MTEVMSQSDNRQDEVPNKVVTISGGSANIVASTLQSTLSSTGTSLIMSTSKPTNQVNNSNTTMTTQKILFNIQPTTSSDGMVSTDSSSTPVQITKLVTVPTIGSSSSSVGGTNVSTGKLPSLVLKPIGTATSGIPTSILSSSGNITGGGTLISSAGGGTGQISAGGQYFSILTRATTASTTLTTNSSSANGSGNGPINNVTNTSSPSTTSSTSEVSTSNGTITTTRFQISDDGQCARCGTVGVRDSFYGRGKQFCSTNCARFIGTTIAGTQTGTSNFFKVITLKNPSSTGYGVQSSGAEGQYIQVALPLQQSSSANAQASKKIDQTGQQQSTSNFSGTSPIVIGAAGSPAQSIISNSSSSTVTSGKIIATPTATTNRLIINRPASGQGKITAKTLTSGRIVAASSGNSAGQQLFNINTVGTPGPSGTITLPIHALQMFKPQTAAQMIANQEAASAAQQQQQSQVVQQVTGQQAITSKATSNTLKRSYSKVSISTSGGISQEVAVVNTPASGNQTLTTSGNSNGGANSPVGQLLHQPAKRIKRNSTSSSSSSTQSKKSKGKQQQSATIVNTSSPTTSTAVVSTSETSNLQLCVASSSTSTPSSVATSISTSNLIKTINSSNQPILLNTSGTASTLIAANKGISGNTSNSILISQLMRKASEAPSSSGSSQTVSTNVNSPTSANMLPIHFDGNSNSANTTTVYVQINPNVQPSGAVFNISNSPNLQQLHGILNKRVPNLVRLNTPNASTDLALANSRLQQMLASGNATVTTATVPVGTQTSVTTLNRTVNRNPTIGTLKTVKLPGSIIQTTTAVATSSMSQPQLTQIANQTEPIMKPLVQPPLTKALPITSAPNPPIVSTPQLSIKLEPVPQQQPVPTPPPPTKAQEIKAMEISIRNSINSPYVVRNLHSITPPVWWLIFDKYYMNRCAPLSAFYHFPMQQEWDDYINGNVAFEIRLIETNGTPQTPTSNPIHNYFVQHSIPNGSNGNGRNSPITSSSGSSSPGTLSKNNFGSKRSGKQIDQSPNGTTPYYWFVRIIENAGCYLKLRFVGLEDNSSHDFWINLRQRNLYPIGYAKSHGFTMKLPDKVEELCIETYKLSVQTMLRQCKNIRHDLYTRFLQQIQVPWMKSQLRLEAQDKCKSACYRPATVVQLIGDRIHVKYEEQSNLAGGSATPSSSENSDNSGLWTHLQGGQIRPIGWSQLIGHELLACNEYAKLSLKRGLEVVKSHIRKGERSAEDWGVMTSEEFYDEKMMYFKEGMKLEAINPFNQLSVSVVTIRRVLRFGFLMLSVDNLLDDPTEMAVFCAHASSPYLLPAGFCKVKGIPLTPPLGYKREFNWVEYTILTNSVFAPIDLFPDYSKQPNGFSEGMLLEAVDILEPNLICVAIVRRVVEHLILLHFIGWEDSLDQWCDCRSPNIFPVGYCDLIKYPLQGPPGKDGGTMTPAKSNRKSSGSRNKRKGVSNTTRQLVFDDCIINHKQQDADTKRTVEYLQEIALESTKNNENNNTEHDSKISNGIGKSREHESIDDDDSCSMSSTELLKRSKALSIEEFNFTSNISQFESVQPSTAENSSFHNSTDDLFDKRRKPKNLVVQLETWKRINIGRKPCYTIDDDYISTTAPPMDSIDISDESFDVSFRYYNEDVEQIEQQQPSTSFVKEDDWSSVPKINLDHVVIDTKNLEKILEWTPLQVAKYLQMIGFAEYSDRVLELKMNGRHLLLLKESGAYKLTNSYPGTLRLVHLVEKLRDKFKQLRANAINSKDGSFFSNISASTSGLGNTSINRQPSTSFEIDLIQIGRGKI